MSAEIIAWVLGIVALVLAFLCLLYRSELEDAKEALTNTGKLYSKMLANRDGIIFSQGQKVERLTEQLQGHEAAKAERRANLSQWGKAGRAKQLGRMPMPDAPLIDGPLLDGAAA